jgi:proton-translocating NAD(P)+ transhydrogenase subunit beta
VSATLIQLAYLVAAVLFILGIAFLSSPRMAVRGNTIAAVGMLIAIVATLLIKGVVNFPVIIAGMIVGSAIGTVLAMRIQMTAMPQMVALLNGFGGGASALVSAAELLRYARIGETPSAMVSTAIVLSALIGGVTFTGSVVAFAKLQELMRGRPITYVGQHIVNGTIGLGITALCVLVAMEPSALTSYWVLFVASHVLGVLLVIPIGGADMPVVISLLNSYSGLAGCTTGFVLNNSGLVISGSLVGASGIVLTKIMCDAMNRSLGNVLFGAFGQAVQSTGPAADGEKRTVRGYTADDAAIVFNSARSAIIVPGYGMAVAQAQHAVRELMDVLEARGVHVKFAIHPVAGRMPGHMNVLLAEANIPYEKLVEMEVINSEFAATDVALVLGANDVVNPAARNDPGSPIYGMPILDVDHAKQVLVIKRSMNPGFAGIDNPLFYNDNTMMVFGDAKGTVLGIVEAVKQL